MKHPPCRSARPAVGSFAAAITAALFAGNCIAGPFFFSTGNVTDSIATASRPDTAGGFEIESADDFLLASATSITSATFTGLIVPSGAASPSIGDIVVEIYRVFPNDSDVGRTAGPPLFGTPKVPTRVNSPSDVAFDSRDSSGGLTFSTTTLSATFTAQNSVQPGGIHSAPSQTTGGDGAVTGAEVQFNVAFTQPFMLPADHYFFVPQVEVTGGTFLWLSGSRPIVPPGTPFAPDLQSWTRDAFLDPDWLRIGTDIVGGAPPPTFNAAFTLAGAAVPEPASASLLLAGVLAMVFARRLRR